VTARVLIAAHRLLAEHPTGIQRYTDELVTALAAAADPTVLHLELVAAREPVEPTWVPREVAVRRLRGPRRVINPAWAAVPFPPLEAHVGRADLVHVLSTAIPVPSRAPQVVTVHDLIPIHHPEWMARTPAWACRRSLRHAARHAARLIVPSHVVGDDLCSTLGVDPARVRVVPEGVSERFRAEVTPQRLGEVRDRLAVGSGDYVVMVGAVSRRKNVPVVLSALAELREAGEPLPVLALAGPEDAGSAGVRALATRLGLDGFVRFLGFVPDADLAVLVSGALALVHPSRDEGFGLTPLEGMAAGVPVVVSGDGAVGEVVGDAAIRAGADDASAWAEALRRLRDDAGHRAEMVRRGRERAATFTWAAAARRTHEVYGECLAEQA
jgi:glycosyltransferase involved in cell wall biosynthesis